MGNITITRRELYDQVWAEPMLLVAQRYGISNVALAKHCRKHNIPKPSRGYWAKKAAGAPVLQMPLPHPMKRDQITIKGRPAKAPLSTPDLQAFVENGIKNGTREENRIVVAETLRAAHPLVREARAQLELHNYKRADGLLHAAGRNGVLDIVVAKTSIRRALLIMDALLKTLNQMGYIVSRGSKVKIIEEVITFRIRENTTVEQVNPSEDPYRRQRLVPSGRLAFEITSGFSRYVRHCRQMWHDGKKKRLEDCLNDIVASLLTAATNMQQYRIEQRRQEDRRHEEWQRQQEEAARVAQRRQQKNKEQARVDALLEEVEDWRSSRHLRAYIETKKKAYIRKHGGIKEGCEFAVWLDWAKKQADRLDPFTESPPSILDEMDTPPNENTQSSWQQFFNIVNKSARIPATADEIKPS